MLFKKKPEIIKSRQEVQPFVINAASQIEIVLTRAASNKHIDIVPICVSYVDTLVAMQVPKKIADQQYAIYLQIEHHQAHNNDDKVAELFADLQALMTDYDVLSIRTDSISELAALMRSEVSEEFLEIFGMNAKPRTFAHQFGESAINSLRAMTAVFKPRP